MKKLLILLFAGVLFIQCKKKETFVTISGSITNAKTKELKLFSATDDNSIKIIELDQNNDFQDTITLPEDQYTLTHNDGYVELYLSPGDHIDIITNAKDFFTNLKITGGNENKNQYFAIKNKMRESTYDDLKPFYHLNERDFKIKFDSVKQTFVNLLGNVKNVKPNFIKSEKENIEHFFTFIANDFKDKKIQSKLIGKPSPKFTNYENYFGGTVSLSDLKGKYTYIDVWATWCKPCLNELPALKQLEQKYGEQINFVSISVDQTTNYEKWKTIVKQENLKGYQLFANNDHGSEFETVYQINSIPRFIIIDPQGNIYNPDAPKPSNKQTAKLLASLIQS